MADNYLEIKMQELRGGVPKPPLHTVRQKSKGKIWIPDISAVNPEEVRRLVKEGWQVWFGGGANPIEASRLARTLRCRYAPAGMTPPPDAVKFPIDKKE